MSKYYKTKVLIIGSGPGGYSAAFRCSDLGLKTIIIEKSENFGGVCLNYGCIPSKSLLYFAKVLDDINKFNNYGIINNNINLFNIDNLNLWKNRIINQLSKGLIKLSELRNVKIIYGCGKLINKNLLKIINNDIFIEFEFVIIATGSESFNLNFEYKYNIWDSKKALEIPFIPKKLLIVGGGIIGLEMATIYKSFGSKIDIIEMSSKILYNLDDDIIDAFYKITKNKFSIIENSIIDSITNKSDDVLYVKIKNINNNNIYYNEYNAILISIGRNPNTYNIGIEDLEIKLDEKGFILVNENMQTNIDNIYAIGDVTGFPMLAHKAIHEAKIASESIYSNNKKKNYTNIIPSIIYSNPEIAWVGINEKYAIENNIDYIISKFPWNSLGKSIIYDCTEGFTKLIFNKNNNKIIGGSVIGYNCSEILGEITLAIEMCCNSEDISLIIHAHPTLYESIGLSSSIIEKTSIDIINK